MSRPQPYRIDWTVEPQSLPEAHQRLATQFESIDQMFQTLFEDLASSVADLATGATGVLPVINGGTNATGVVIGGVAYGISGAVTGPAYAFTAAGTSQTLLISNGTGAPTFGAADLSGAGIGGVLPLARGGTNATGAAVTGGVIYSDATKWLATAAGTAGQVLLSSGTSAPVFGLLGLVTGITGILPLVNGGTNASGAAVTGGVIYSDATKWLASAAGTAGHFLVSSGTAAPKFVQIDLASTGVSGILPIVQGGTGLSTLAAGRIPYGSGASPLNSTGTFIFDGTKLSFPGQLQFPATQAASADANCLDDYEEGSWTPVDASTGALSFTGATGTYIKLGRGVLIGYQLSFPTTTGTGNAQIGGLPFNPDANYGLSLGYTENAAFHTLYAGPGSVITTLLPAVRVMTNADWSAKNHVGGGYYRV
jgi:hypothetical protein